MQSMANFQVWQSQLLGIRVLALHFCDTYFLPLSLCYVILEKFKRAQWLSKTKIIFKYSLYITSSKLSSPPQKWSTVCCSIQFFFLLVSIHYLYLICFSHNKQDSNIHIILWLLFRFLTTPELFLYYDIQFHLILKHHFQIRQWTKSIWKDHQDRTKWKREG